MKTNTYAEGGFDPIIYHKRPFKKLHDRLLQKRPKGRFFYASTRLNIKVSFVLSIMSCETMKVRYEDLSGIPLLYCGNMHLESSLLYIFGGWTKLANIGTMFLFDFHTCPVQ